MIAETSTSQGVDNGTKVPMAGSPSIRNPRLEIAVFVPMWSAGRVVAVLGVAGISYSCLGQLLPGFNLTGETWTYDPGDGGLIITGILSSVTNGFEWTNPAISPASQTFYRLRQTD